jgi:hypothetical protein
MIPPHRDIPIRRLSLKLGLRNGLFIGLALALGTWLLQAIGLSTAHVRAIDTYAPLLLGLTGLLLLGALAGWLAAWRSSALWGGLVWLLAAALMTWTIGHLPYEGRNLAIWLADRHFWRLPVYAFSPAAQARLLMAGFFLVLLLAILGLLQSYRLEGIQSETDADGRLGARAWFLLIVPLPLVFAAGLAADDLVNKPERLALRLVHEAIRIGRTYPGDLFALSLEQGVNYNAIAGVRDQMSAGYSLLTGGISLGASNAVAVVAHFDNGAWINCQVAADQLIHCYDASLPYRQGLPALLTSGETPQDCQPCIIKVGDEQRDWLLAQRGDWAASPRVTRLAQWGSYVLVQARSPADGHAVECLFHGIRPATLDHCRKIRTET